MIVPKYCAALEGFFNNHSLYYQGLLPRLVCFALSAPIELHITIQVMNVSGYIF